MHSEGFSAGDRLLGLDALARDLDDLAGRDVAHVLGADDVEPARLAGDDPAALVELAEDERAHAVRVAERVDARSR